MADILNQDNSSFANNWQDPSYQNTQQYQQKEIENQIQSQSQQTTTSNTGSVFTDEQVSLKGGDNKGTAPAGTGSTLSKAQLDSLQSGSPVITGPKQNLSAESGTVGKGSFTKMPGGPAGSGNAFFNPNPMVVIFSMFQALIQVLKDESRVSIKLTAGEMNAMKDTGESTADYEIQQGKDQATSDYIQMGMAIGGAVAGGLPILGAAGSTMRGLKAFGTEAHSMSEEADAAETASRETETLNNPETSRLTQSLQIKEARLSELENEQNTLNKSISVTQDVDQGGTKAQNTAEKEAEKSEDTEDTAQTENESDILSTTSKNKEDEKTALTEQEQKRLDEIEEIKSQHPDEFDEVSADYKGDDPQAISNLRKDIAKEKTALTALQRETAIAKREAAQLKSKAESFTRNKVNYMNNFRANDIWTISTNSASGMINSASQAGQHYGAAWGAMATANDQANTTLMQTYQQMDQRALDNTISFNQQSTQWIGELTQALQNMSDREQQSMHWSTA